MGLVFSVLQGLNKGHCDTLVSADIDIEGINRTAGCGASVPLVGSDLDGLISGLDIGRFNNVAGTQRVTVLKSFDRVAQCQCLA